MTNPEIKMVKYEDLLIIKKLVYYLRGFGMWDFTEWLAFDKDSNKPFNGIAQRSENEVIERHTFEDIDGVENLTKILSTLDDDSNVFIISHKGDVLENKFRSKIEFYKDRNFSKIK